MKFQPLNAPLRSPRFLGAALAALIQMSAGVAAAQTPIKADEVPAGLEGVGITEHLNEKIPLELTFKDESGKDVQLGDYFVKGRPVILTLNYFRCPMLCTLTLNGMVEALNQLDWSAGKEFAIITVSINPDEKPDLADVKKQAYLTQYKRETAKDGWHFLTGNSHEIQQLAKAAGFGYRYDPQTGNYAHTSTIMFLTPDGRLSRYINDVKFEPKTVRLALIEASEGAIGSPMEQFLIFMCYHYDPQRGGYAASAAKLMRMGGALSAALLAAGIGVLWLRGGKHDKETRRRNSESATTPSNVSKAHS